MPIAQTDTPLSRVSGRGAGGEGKKPGRESGFTYLALLFAVALSGIALAATGIVWSTERQREREQELLFVGGQFRAAIASYYLRSPGLVKRYPAKLDDLLKDNRFLGVKRHLRQIYPDPMTDGREWGLVTAPEGGIMGVYSTSTKAPIKQAKFPAHFDDFEGKANYAQWRFIFRPVSPAAPQNPSLEGSSSRSSDHL